MITPILPLSDKALEALSYVIVTATEGGHYTREDYAEWTTYKHGDTEKGFRAEVTLHPNDDVEGISLEPIRMTPEELGKRLAERFNLDKMPSHHALMILRLLAGDEDIAGEMDVIDSGAILQVAVYGETIYG
ncbi:hypothetical protein UFOVP549_16 [uncultured Caudovirales phage]|uniref:Uncharacterized protein n=1 Tax=uncultured Caudovirales phage TaxID=2100421 RepID=A0A6J5N206_9CAUD|nr:hypothetical protein UFOVP549_16 [uncultured Caudovirales phage]